VAGDVSEPHFDIDAPFLTVGSLHVDLVQLEGGSKDGRRLVALLASGWSGTTEELVKVQVVFQVDDARSMVNTVTDLLDRMAW
jgi:hypothetical protein